jgi:hypothetical protein
MIYLIQNIFKMCWFITSSGYIICSSFIMEKNTDTPFHYYCCAFLRSLRKSLRAQNLWEQAFKTLSNYDTYMGTWTIKFLGSTTLHDYSLLYDYFPVVRVPVQLLHSSVRLLPAIFRRTFVWLHCLLSSCINWDRLLQAAQYINY